LVFLKGSRREGVEEGGGRGGRGARRPSRWGKGSREEVSTPKEVQEKTETTNGERSHHFPRALSPQLFYLQFSRVEPTWESSLVRGVCRALNDA
jgi:hypothetical protein